MEGGAVSPASRIRRNAPLLDQNESSRLRVNQQKSPGCQSRTSVTSVEMAGVEPASKQGTQLLSTRLADRFVLLLEPGRRQPNPSPSLSIFARRPRRCAALSLNE